MNSKKEAEKIKKKRHEALALKALLHQGNDDLTVTFGPPLADV